MWERPDRKCCTHSFLFSIGQTCSFIRLVKRFSVNSVQQTLDSIEEKDLQLNTKWKRTGFRYYLSLHSKYERTKKQNSSHTYKWASEKRHICLAAGRMCEVQPQDFRTLDVTPVLYNNSLLSIFPELISVIDMRIIKSH